MEKSFSMAKRTARKKSYKYINTNTKNDQVSFQNFQKLFDEGELKWVDEKFECSLFKNCGNLVQLQTEKHNENDRLNILSEYNTFWVLVNGKTFSSVNWI